MALLTLAQAADRLGRSPSTLRVQVHHGRLHAELYGKTYLVDEDEVERYRRENLGNRGRPQNARRKIAAIRWHSSMYRALTLRVDVEGLTPAQEAAVVELARRGIDLGAWTLAEVRGHFVGDERVAGLKIELIDAPPTIYVRKAGS